MRMDHFRRPIRPTGISSVIAEGAMEVFPFLFVPLLSFFFKTNTFDRFWKRGNQIIRWILTSSFSSSFSYFQPSKSLPRLLTPSSTPSLANYLCLFIGFQMILVDWKKENTALVCFMFTFISSQIFLTQLLFLDRCEIPDESMKKYLLQVKKQTEKYQTSLFLNHSLSLLPPQE